MWQTPMAATCGPSGPAMRRAIQGVADPVAALRVELLFLRSVIIGSTLTARLAGIRAIEPPTQ